MKTTFLIFILSLFFLFSYSQVEDAKKKESYRQSHIFGEAAGPGISLSANYEKSFWKGKNGIAFCAGAGLVPFISTAGITLPVGVNYIHGEKNCYELGTGTTPLIFTGKYSNDTELLLYLLTGYRRLILNGDAIGRIFFSPFFAKKGSILASNLDIKGSFIPYGGISLGIALKGNK